MRLIGIPDASGQPAIWINADHLVSVQPIYSNDGTSDLLTAELKVDGMPLYRVKLGTFDTRAAAQAKWAWFLEELQRSP